jgi:hypothetical protein
MSGQRKIPNVGENFTFNEVQRIANVAAAGDDRALEILATPGSTQKKIMPLLEETATLNPRLLVVGHDTDAGAPNGSVRLRPAHFVAGVANGPYDVGLGAKQKANLDSPQFAANSAGVPRTDLLYATISYGATTTVTKRQKPPTGGAPLAQPLIVAADPAVTLSIIPGVAASNPLVSLPADPAVDAIFGGTYNFALAAVSIPAGYVAGSPINQASITPLWNGGWIPPHRVRGLRVPNWGGANPPERPSSQMSERFSSYIEFIIPWKLLPNTPQSGVVVDTSIDWRHRMVWGYGAWTGLSATAYPLETLAGAGRPTSVGALDTTTYGLLGPSPSGDGVPSGGGSGVVIGTILYGGAHFNASAQLIVDSNGHLLVGAGSGPGDKTNGDMIVFVVRASDQIINGM